MIAQLSNSSKVHRLHVNKTTDLNTQLSVVVEESGTYQVTIFPIRGDRGIVDSNVEYSGQVTVSNFAMPGTTMSSIILDNNERITTVGGDDSCSNDNLFLMIIAGMISI